MSIVDDRMKSLVSESEATREKLWELENTSVALKEEVSSLGS